jgi:hypothetical protein
MQKHDTKVKPELKRTISLVKFSLNPLGKRLRKTLRIKLLEKV